jgi:hypothetical protein
MVFFSDSPTGDAIVYMNRPEIEPEIFQCSCCKESFEEGSGFKTDDDYFCTPCVSGNQHIVFYRDVVKLDHEFVIEYLKSLTNT